MQQEFYYGTKENKFICRIALSTQALTFFLFKVNTQRSPLLSYSSILKIKGNTVGESQTVTWNSTVTYLSFLCSYSFSFVYHRLLLLDQMNTFVLSILSWKKKKSHLGFIHTTLECVKVHYSNNYVQVHTKQEQI